MSDHQPSDATWDAFADGDWIISFRCQQCGEWIDAKRDGEECLGVQS